MESLLLMTASGSLMVVFYILVKVFMRDRINAVWKYRILKAALFFYLIPVHASKIIWTKVYYTYFANEHLPAVWLSDDIMQISKDRLPSYSLNHTLKYIYFAVVTIILVVLVYKMLIYVRECRIVLKHPAGRNDGKIEAGIKQQKDSLGIKRRISCRVYSGSLCTFTIGVFRPVIALDDSGCDGDERELVIKHELVHIKNWDGLIKILGMIAAAIHFFNPFVYFLLYKLSVVSEFACDERVVSGMDDKEMKKYCRLLFEMAQKKKKGIYMIPFKGSKNEVKERIEMMINGKNRKKGWQIFAGAMLSLMIIFVSSMTTFAYEPPTVFEVDDSGKEIEQGHGDIDRLYVKDGHESTDNYFDADMTEMSFGNSDAYFMDEQGNRYDVPKNAARLFCNHNYDSGKYYEHIKSGGGCTINIYNAERCTKCGTIHVKDFCNSITYAKCIH